MAGWSKDLQLATAQSRIGKIPRSATGLGREVAEAAQRMRDEQCRALADATSDLIFCLDKDLNLTEVNRSAARSLGLSSQEAIGRNIAELGLPPETMRRWKEKCHGVLASGQAAERLLNEFILADGVTHLNETSLWPILSAEGQVVGVLGVTRDLTEQTQAQELLRASEQGYRTLFESANDGIILTDESGRILDVNTRTCETLGFTGAELLGVEIADIDCPPSELDGAQLRERALAGEQVTFETRQRRKDGSLLPVEVTLSGLNLASGRAFLGIARDISKRKQSEEALKRSQAQLENAMELADLVSWELNAETGVFTFNDRFYALYGTTAEIEGGYQMPAEVYARKFVHPDDQHMVAAEIEGAIKTSDPNYRGYVEHRIVRRDGEIRNIIVRYRITKDDQGMTISCHGANQDITERKRTEEALTLVEEQLRQVQKMEAVGQLAGGIAHDFNNILTAVIGYADLILAPGRTIDDSCRPDMEEIRIAAERASTLTRQILAFSRRQALRPAVVSLNEVVAGTDRLLRRTLGEDIDLVTNLGVDLGLVEVDVSQFEQVLINLALNARDAMSQGGRLTIETANTELGEEYAGSHPEVKPGPYVMLSVTDTGVGMDEETMARAFEPFFTTKEPGRGTGLGLSTAYGMIKQSGGNVILYSEPGQGTTVKVCLPRLEVQGKSRPATAAPRGDSARGSESILVVEDEEAVRTFVTRVLSGLGYEVIGASSGREALSLLSAGGRSVDILLTDVILPGEYQGNQIAQEVKASHPELPVLFMSGYTRDAIIHAGRLDEGVDYIEKPFTAERLGKYVREILDRPGLEVLGAG